jgi:hypothetical protein
MSRGDEMRDQDAKNRRGKDRTGQNKDRRGQQQDRTVQERRGRRGQVSCLGSGSFRQAR